ncbi:MAG: phosphatidylglycerophosphatase A [Bacteroidetes bacterium]|jgi:phosphatidylglycerophosphatase A|uniref:Phosphatidylglycerophosphatase A n=1 Tax=Rhodohalobacter sulfatireducens TaxID=2911366 RepID=A0ABS9KI00_9BACT|nr:phosphatidylglycerophosphatase A [Rhodohalobacter sulfatireducens]MCG2590484.1 phosphatidylglycerophosphatase A [Rhodohalobacter sulfatireducens]MDR9365364.1 phosphatidylglycerophosphatase A [Balneolaceae bacterium]MDR9408854.1 phosphatidylglycerophosphatase A [Balneolaceae bacterium]NBC65023.1 phosphatidylglycerophosphatase A [Bacteroidota bacterium]
MNIRLAIGTLFGTGNLPIAPGTWGSLFTLPMIYAAEYFIPNLGIPLLFAACFVLSLYSASAAMKQYGQDPAQFVMDECAGQSLVFILGGFSFTFTGDVLLLVFGFLLFRFFDILKPLGVDKLQNLPGEIGILADDLLAGVYAFICLEGSIYLYQTLL